MKNTEILDTTLRDGMQAEGISFSVNDKLNILKLLDSLCIDFAEVGTPASNVKDNELFERLPSLELKHVKPVAFSSTCHINTLPESDAALNAAAASGCEYVSVFGKAWLLHVEHILCTTAEENLRIIKESIEFLRNKDKKVFFDAEHFFDGYKANPEYALMSLKSAVKGGAICLSLCDTNGGTMPSQIKEIVEKVVKEFTPEGVTIGIHTHNDTGMAVANSVIAVEAGAGQVQGTFIGIGERTGNANLSTIIPNLELKLGYKCLPEGNIRLLTPYARRIAEIANVTLEETMPYVGQTAFAHKAGMHIDAVTKNTTAYEHVSPELVGNERVFLMSEVAGRSMIIEKIKKFDKTITKDSPVAAAIIQQVKELEHEGYQFEGADGSFELLVRKAIGKYQPFFKLHYYKILGEQPPLDKSLCSFAQLKIEVDGKEEITAGEGDGPVHALDVALRKALEHFFPAVADIRLTDYKVRVLDSKSATAARVRVLIESTDGIDQWATVGVSPDVMAASWQALVDSFEYKLIKDVEKKFKAYI